MSTYEERVASLRPLASRAAVEGIFPREAFHEHRSGEAIGVKVAYGERGNDDPRGLDTSNVVEQLGIRAPFPSSLSFYGFSIGMALPEAAPLIAHLGLDRASEAAGFTTFSGPTPDGFELRLLFDHSLTQIQISQPHHKAIAQARRAFWQERAELKARQWEEANAWKQITDNDDAMIDTWAAHCRPWNDYSPEEFVKFAAWLKNATPDERHMAAMHCNWDYGIAPLLWIVRQPDCDVATAVYIFFGCQPSHCLGPDGDGHRAREASMGEVGAMMREIRERMESGFYARSEIRFDASREIEALHRVKLDDAQLAEVLPPNMKPRYEGRRLDDGNGYDGLSMPHFEIN